jgi:rfaE bifunctional protein nucleotidyltransferase chain/domain
MFTSMGERELRQNTERISKGRAGRPSDLIRLELEAGGASFVTLPDVNSRSTTLPTNPLEEKETETCASFVKAVTERSTFIKKIRSLASVITSVKVGSTTNVLCHGCYDIIGPAHIEHLLWARGLGDNLIVSISSDEVVAETKGAGRPIMPLGWRLLHMAAFEFVAFVIPWYERTADRLIEELRPKFYVKGSDTGTSEEFAREVSTARSVGCQIRYSPTQSNYHTTDIVKLLSSGVGATIKP